MEEIRGRHLEKATREYIQRNLQLAGIRGSFYAALTFLAGLSAVIALWAWGIRVLEGRLSLGGFVAFNAYLTMITWPMMSLGFMVNLFQRGRASMDRLEEIFEERPRIESPPRPSPLKPAAGDMEFLNISYRYPESSDWALRGITLRIAAGSKVAITGPVGSGKTTLLELIPRIIDPTEGKVLLGGRDIRDLSLRELRSQIGWVAQEPFLFSDTLIENISFRNPGTSKKEVERLVHMVRLDKDLDAFPQGLETPIGERGIAVSGGPEAEDRNGQGPPRGPSSIDPG